MSFSIRTLAFATFLIAAAAILFGFQTAVGNIQTLPSDFYSGESVGSLAGGLVSIPAQSAYNASKFGVRGFTDALRMELDIEPCGVSATTIHPGGIKTNIARNARLTDSLADVGGNRSDFGADFDKLARTTPDKAARQILKAVERNRRRALIGPDAVAFDLMSRLPAGLYQRILVASSRRQRRDQSVAG